MHYFWISSFGYSYPEYTVQIVIQLMKKVTILKRYDRKFRLPLYDLLGQRLLDAGIELKITFGDPDGQETPTIKDVITENRWGVYVKNRYIKIGNHEICWQPVWKYFKQADLIIIQQSNRLLLNYLIQLRRIFFRKPLIAFWGHGMNFQAANPNSVPEKVKAFYSNHVDYWFAYNELSADIIAQRGFSKDRIFSLQNTIDTHEERILYDAISEKELSALRSKLGIRVNDLVGIYCGSLYAHKRIEFLIKALLKIKSELNQFHFIFVGDGIMRDQLLSLIEEHRQWIHFQGAQFGKEKLKYFKLASFQMIPGLVGLNVIDSFVTVTPLITTDNKLHSPEISYLENYNNGIITENSLESYAGAVIDYAKSKSLQQKLSEGCMKARETYTIENMAANFYNGIIKALN